MEKEKEVAAVNERVLATLEGLQEPNGMYELYDVTLNRIEEILFVGVENVTLPDDQVLSLLRTLRMLRQDLRVLGCPNDPPKDDSAENI